MEAVLRIILGATVVMAVGLGGIGLLIGSRAGARARTAMFGLALVLFAGFVLGTYPLAQKHGSLVTQQSALLGLALSAALLGGFLAGAKRSQSPTGNWGSALAVSGIVVLVALGLIHRTNQKLADTVHALGLDEKPPIVAETDKGKNCPDNLKSLYSALEMYARDWDALPPGANWMENEELATVKAHPDWLHCPAVSQGKDNKYGYAYNATMAGKKLGGKPLNALPEAAKTPLITDSSDLAKNAHDAPNSLPNPGRHGGKNNILYCDGHVEAVAPK